VLSVGQAALTRAWKRGELVSVPFIADVSCDLEEEEEQFMVGGTGIEPVTPTMSTEGKAKKNNSLD
jgi:hypothetical protein